MKKELFDFMRIIFESAFMPIFLISFIVSYAICWIRVGNYWAKEYFNKKEGDL